LTAVGYLTVDVEELLDAADDLTAVLPGGRRVADPAVLRIDVGRVEPVGWAHLAGGGVVDLAGTVLGEAVADLRDVLQTDVGTAVVAVGPGLGVAVLIAADPHVVHVFVAAVVAAVRREDVEVHVVAVG